MKLNDKQILKLCKDGLIDPYIKTTELRKGLSHGPSTFGYDVTLGNKFKVPTYVTNDRNESIIIINPEFPANVQYDSIMVEDHYTLQPGAMVLGYVNEKIDLPSDITAQVHDKSTYSRHGVAVQNTVVEAGWKGHLTLEITNHSRFHVMLLVGSGIAQLTFFQGEPCGKPYAKDGKYQDQGPMPITSRRS